MAFFIERDNSRSEDLPQTADEVEYEDPLIPTKLPISYLPNEILREHILESWSGEVLGLMDNSAPLYDSFREEEPADKLNAELPELAYNFRYEKVEYAPTILKTEMCFGRGVAKLGNGLTYNGDMAFSHLHGQGVLEGPGFKYSGTFRNSELEGEGFYEWAQSKYAGDVKRGIRNGNGTLEYINGPKYEGGWREGLREGYGKLVYPSGQSYEGQWEKGKKHGKGVLKYANGNFYDGQFYEDLRSGSGTMYWKTLQQKYSGHWREGNPHGFGIHIWLDTKGSKQLRNRYVGEWQNGKRHGQGVFYYANGSKYEGQWEGNLKHGEGKMTFEDGSVYFGQFLNDHMVDRTLSGKPESTTVTESVTVSAAVPPQTSATNRRSLATRSTISSKKAPPTASSTNQLKRKVEKNPYSDLLDISDLLESEPDPAKAEREVEKLLLKYNSRIKSWYEHYSEKVEASPTEESFTMTARQLWRFLRDGNVVSYKVSLASINRLFLKGKKNLFEISNKIAETRLDSSIGKASRPYTPGRASGMPSPVHMIPSALEISYINVEAEDNEYLTDEEVFMENDLFDVHDPERPVLFRQFAEAIVRAAYLKYGRGQNLVLENEKLQAGSEEFYVERSKTQLGISLYKLMTERLVKLIGEHTVRTPEEDARNSKAQELLNKSIVEELFIRYAWNNRSTLNGRLDQTIQVKGVLQLSADSRIVPELVDRQRLLQLIEKYHDPEDRISESGLSGKSLLALFGSELTKYEFFELICQLSTLLKGKNIQVKMEALINKYFNDLLGPSLEEVIAVEETEKPNEESKGESAHADKVSEESDDGEVVLKGKRSSRTSEWMWLETDKQRAYVKRREAKKLEQEQADKELKKMALEDIDNGTNQHL